MNARTMFRGTALVSSALVAAAACKSSGSHLPADAPARTDARPDARPDARLDAAVDAAVCGGVSSPCNLVTNRGSIVTPTCIAGSPPSMTGGSIVDGTYILISAQAYASSCTGLSLPQGGPTTFILANGCMQSIDAQGGAQNYAISTTSNMLSFDQTCPGSLTYSLTYTATATVLSELAPLSPSVMIVSVFQKQ